MSKELVIFLTHNFRPKFLDTLRLFDKVINKDKYDAVILFDATCPFKDITFSNINIVKINRLNIEYDSGGHTMYINYFKSNPDVLNNYKNYWIVENDVYFHGSFKLFFDIHYEHNYDLMVPESGIRPAGWCWYNKLTGFNNKENIGIMAFIMRISQRLMKTLIETLDVKYNGYLEILLPHIVKEYNYTKENFIPDLIGEVSTCETKIIMAVKQDIINNTNIVLEENRLYHPIKL